eukprot:s117_g31.t1
MFAPARFAEFLFDHASSEKSVSLTNAIVAFFRQTEGPGNRKAFLPSKLVHYIRPNRDVAKAGLKDLLSLAAQFLDGSLEKIFVSNACGKKSQNVWQVDIDRNGNYSRTFGRWCGSKPAAVRDQVLQHLDTLNGIRGVEELKARVADGSSGETMVLINACKCMHVIKNWVFLKRSSST